MLLEEAEAKKRRKQEETRIALESIQRRISTTLHDYREEKEGPSEELSKSEDADKSVEVTFENIEDPTKLYDLLADVRLRSKYEKHLTVVVVQLEEKQQQKDQVLHSLDDFFQETKAGNTEQLIAEVEAEEIDFEEATSGLESALVTATEAATKLLAIEKEIGQLISVAAAYPDTKKGRKKLEKALVKAQDNVQNLTASLDSIKQELDQSKTKCDQLQLSLDAKTAECGKLRKNADQAKKLQLNNDSLKAELANLSSLLKKAEDEVKKLQKSQAPATVTQTVPIEDERRIKELEVALEESRALNSKLQAEKDESEKKLQEELQTVKAQYEAEIAEMKATQEEQLRSLIIDDNDMFGEEEEEVGGEEEETNITSPPPSGSQNNMQLVEEVDAPSLEETTTITDNSEAELLRKFNERENALKSELAEVKSKSRKVATSLKAQLAEAQLKLQTAESSQAGAIEDLKRQMNEISQEKDNAECLYQELLAKQKTQSENECEKHTKRIQELEIMVEELNREIQKIILNQQSSGSSLQLHIPASFANHSTQWSDGVVSAASTPRSSDRPLVQMEEVVHSAQFSSPLSNRSIVMDGGSMASLPNVYHHGSPLQSSTLLNGKLPEFAQVLPGPTLSHLSPHSNYSGDSISLDHPIMQEWSKAFEQVMKFKENVVRILQNSSVPSSAIEGLQDLLMQEGVALDKDADLSSQVTQMRFTLALTLHQLETTLQDSFAALTLVAVGDSTVLQNDKLVRLQQQVSFLQKQLHSAEDRHKNELKQSQETIANLSVKIESLKMEISTLRRCLSEAGESEGKGVVFFTRLDVERNEKVLQEAVLKQQISEEDCESILSDMEDYLSLPGQRLQHIRTQLQQQVGIRRTIVDVRNSSSSPEHTTHVLNMIQQLQTKRQDEFSLKMEKMSLKRLELAEKIQKGLTRVEKGSRTFLIKPMYPSRPHTSIMVPLDRKPPSYRAPSTAMCTPRKRDATPQGTPHPAIMLINELRSEQASRQTYSLSDRGVEFSTGPTSVGTSNPVSDARTNWTVSTSQTPQSSIDYSPVLPRLVELEISKIRQPDILLGHATTKSRESLSRSLIKNGTIIHNGKFGKRPSNGSALPPIRVPGLLQEQLAMS